MSRFKTWRNWAVGSNPKMKFKSADPSSSKMSVWDRLTLATRYEAMLPENIKVVKQKLKRIEEMAQTDRREKIQIEFPDSADQSKQGFTEWALAGEKA
jgi:hypothetical protein